MGFYQVSCCLFKFETNNMIFFFSNNNHNNLLSRIYCKNIIDILFLFYHFILVKIVQ